MPPEEDYLIHVENDSKTRNLELPPTDPAIYSRVTAKPTPQRKTIANNILKITVMYNNNSINGQTVCLTFKWQICLETATKMPRLRRNPKTHDKEPIAVKLDETEIQILQKIKQTNEKTNLRRKRRKNCERRVTRACFSEQTTTWRHLRYVIGRSRVTWPGNMAPFIRNPCTTIRLTLHWWGAGQSLSIPERR